MRQFKKVQTVTDDYAERFKKYEIVSKITRELLVDLIDKVYIDKTENPDASKKKQSKHVKVVFKFVDEHKALTAFITENAQQQYKEMLVVL